MIYESRPNVTVDAAGLSIKSGNAIILRGGSEAINSNTYLGELITQSLRETGFHSNSVQIIKMTDREAVGELITMSNFVDVIIIIFCIAIYYWFIFILFEPSDSSSWTKT